MKPAPFEYHRPATVAEASEMLSDDTIEAKVIAGGQSLMPALNMRLVTPSRLVDINRIPGLDSISVAGGQVRLGALVRQRVAERSGAVTAACPLLGQALTYVAHSPIRTRGTVVGSLVHADPAAELPAVLLLLGGSVTVSGPDGERTIGADELFLGAFETSLRPRDVAVAATFPAIAPGSATAFVEMARRQGDFAICAVAALVRGAEARVALAGVDALPRMFDVSGLLDGDHDAALDAVAEGIEPEADIHASTEYRRHLARELTKLAVAEATGAGRR
jgi:aerobic carbon-monoxide dehydrogenase medium subunit